LNRSLRFFGGDIPVADIDRNRLNEYRQHLEQEGLARRSIIKYEGCLNQLLDWVAEDETYGLHYRRPRRPRALAEPSPAPSPVEWLHLDSFIRTALRSPRCPWAWKLAILLRYTGLRCGEATRLRWEHVQDKWIHVPADLVKTNRGRRVPIASALFKFLNEWRDLSGWLIHDIPPGARHKQTTIAQAFNRIWERAHLEEHVPRQAFGHLEGRGNGAPTHTFRHCFSNQLKRNGARWDAVEAILGHHSSRGVSSHYDFLEPDMIEAVELIPPMNGATAKLVAIGGAR